MSSRNLAHQLIHFKHIHRVYTTPLFSRFWTQVAAVLSTALITTTIPLTTLFLLNHDSPLQLSVPHHRLLLACLTAAKKSILQLWHFPTLPFISTWLNNSVYGYS